MSTTTALTSLFTAICDDAAVFPPGDMPLERALPRHLAHRREAHAALVGPLVLSAADLEQLPRILRVAEAGAHAELGIALSVTLASAAGALRIVRTTDRVRLDALEVTLSAADRPREAITLLDELNTPPPTVFVEVPRDERRTAFLHALSGTPYAAKFRTGGVRADLYPDEYELADAVHLAVQVGVPFKATAGLHHAVRNTDPITGFEQHGFCNLLVATHAALTGARPAELAALLAERDRAVVAGLVRAVSPEARAAFRSFGTCSIHDPLTELAEVGLIRSDLVKDL